MRSVDETLRPMQDFRDRTMYSATPPARSAAWQKQSVARPNANGLYRYSVPGFMMSPPSIDKIALYHYITKSRQDFVDKRSRGSGTAKVRTWDEFDEVSRCAANRVVPAVLRVDLKKILVPSEASGALRHGDRWSERPLDQLALCAVRQLQSGLQLGQQ